jgi:hypothetical protein
VVASGSGGISSVGIPVLTFLASLVARVLEHDRRGVVFHEPIRQDFRAIVEARRSERAAIDYAAHRKRKMCRLARKASNQPDTLEFYGEINSALRFHGRALRSAFPGCAILQLVRDGRDVVRSIMARRHYTDGATGHHAIAPEDGEPFSREWSSMTRFEKICWLWKDGNSRLSPHADALIRFEDLVSDYEYFRQHLEIGLGLAVGRETWQRLVASPANATEQFTMPQWKEWEPDLRSAFERICGDEMRRLGYS